MSELLQAPPLPATDASIAVLPFHSLDEDARLHRFAEGFTWAITNALTRFELLRVLARQSGAGYDSRAIDMRRAGRELGVRFLLAGSVERNGERIRVHASLTDASDGVQLWADTCDREINDGDLFRLQDELAQAVVAQMADIYGPLSRTLSSESDEKPVEALTPYEAFMRFLAYLTYTRDEDFHLARDALEAALAREFSDSTCWAALSMLNADAYLRGFSSAPDLLEQVWSMANHAVTLAPDSVVAHTARASAAYVCSRPEIVVEEAECMLELNPNDASTSGYAGYLLGFAGDLDRAVAIHDRVRRLNAVYPSWQLSVVCLYHYMRGEYPEALQVTERITHPCWPLKPLMAAIIHGQAGRQEQGAAQLRLLETIEPGFARDPAGYVQRRFIDEQQMEKVMDGLALLVVD